MKLLNYTATRYLMFTALLLLISIPVFYVLLNRIFIRAIDHDLYQQAKEIPLHQNSIMSERDLALWRTLDNDLEIVHADSVAWHQGPFTEKQLNQEGEKEDFRILQKKISMLGEDYIVQIKSSMIEKEDLVQAVLLIQLSMFCLLALGATLINYLINRKVWRPFYEVLFFLENFNLEKTITGLPGKAGIREFNQLNQSVHQLAVSVSSTYLSQKEFTENASHELQTPLAILKFKLELLLQEKGLSENQGGLIDGMYQVITQLEQLNKNLLLLSKMDNHQFTFEEQLEINGIVAASMEDLHFMAAAKKQEIAIKTAQEEIFLRGNPQLFKNLVKNLLRNAILYSGEHATIRISIQSNGFSICNPGGPLEIPQDKLFTRFSKIDNRKGTGLGLAIAQKIAALHHLQLNYRYEAGSHCFMLNW